jgi:hypothetical protein
MANGLNAILGVENSKHVLVKEDFPAILDCCRMSVLSMLLLVTVGIIVVLRCLFIN